MSLRPSLAKECAPVAVDRNQARLGYVLSVGHRANTSAVLANLPALLGFASIDAPKRKREDGGGETSCARLEEESFSPVRAESI